MSPTEWLSALNPKRWLTTLSLVLGAIGLALAGAKANSIRKRAQQKDQKAEKLLASNSSKEIQKGKKLRESAQKDLDKAAEAQKAMKAKVEEIGNANEDLDELMHRFNSERVRQSGS